MGFIGRMTGASLLSISRCEVGDRLLSVNSYFFIAGGGKLAVFLLGGNFLTFSFSRVHFRFVSF